MNNFSEKSNSNAEVAYFGSYAAARSARYKRLIMEVFISISYARCLSSLSETSGMMKIKKFQEKRFFKIRDNV